MTRPAIQRSGGRAEGAASTKWNVPGPSQEDKEAGVASVGSDWDEMKAEMSQTRLHRTFSPQRRTPEFSQELEAGVACFGQGWHVLGRGVLPPDLVF